MKVSSAPKTAACWPGRRRARCRGIRWRFAAGKSGWFRRGAPISGSARREQAVDSRRAGALRSVYMNTNKPKLVVVGNGMAGARVVEEILKRAPDRFDITMFGAEPYGNYNRILLSNVLNGSQDATGIFMNPLSWYEKNNIKLHAGVKA